MVIVYPVHSGLYVNLTNRCPCDCTFCIRQKGEGVHGSDSLWLEREPEFEEVRDALEEADYKSYSEIVFCGYGEPTEAFDVLKQTASYIKQNSDLPVRLNTNGLGSLVNQRNIAPEMNGLIDGLSVSLNTSSAETYCKIVRPKFGAESYPALIEFIREAKKYVPHIMLTAVATTITAEDETECRRLAGELGVEFRVREFV